MDRPYPVPPTNEAFRTWTEIDVPIVTHTLNDGERYAERRAILFNERMHTLDFYVVDGTASSFECLNGKPWRIVQVTERNGKGHPFHFLTLWTYATREEGICEDCRENYVWCTVCKDLILRDTALYAHRHLFLSVDGDWLGSGGENMTTGMYKEVKASLFTVFKKTGLASLFRTAIQQGEMGYKTLHFYGPCIGGPPSIWCWLASNDHGDCFTNALTEEQEQAMSLGVGWLVSLVGTETQEANDVTVQWIQEYLAIRLLLCLIF